MLPKAWATMGELSVRIVVPMAMKKLERLTAVREREGGGGAYPNVAAEPAMYCPRVRSMPFGPGPKRTMLVKPGSVSSCLYEAGVWGDWYRI